MRPSRVSADGTGKTPAAGGGFAAEPRTANKEMTTQDNAAAQLLDELERSGAGRGFWTLAPVAGQPGLVGIEHGGATIAMIDERLAPGAAALVALAVNSLDVLISLARLGMLASGAPAGAGPACAHCGSPYVACLTRRSGSGRVAVELSCRSCGARQTTIGGARPATHRGGLA
jgi:hypothetical protein